MDQLSQRQAAILSFIKQEVVKRGYPPSVREIGEAVGLASSSTVHGHLERLEKKGYIRRDPTKPRAIEILYDSGEKRLEDDRRRLSLLPIIGKVTAGQPITAVENIEGYFPLPEDQLSSHAEERFVLRVQGDSMVDAGIRNGDLVIVNRQSTAQNGDIIVALTEEGEATIKRFFKEADRIRLQPENPSMHPLYYRQIRILGKVVALFRELV